MPYLKEAKGYIELSINTAFFVSNTVMARSALDIRIEKGMQAFPKIKTSATIDANIERKVKEEAKEEILTKKNQRRSRCIMEDSSDNRPYIFCLIFKLLTPTKKLIDSVFDL